MNETLNLITRRQSQGRTLAPGSSGKLRASPPVELQWPKAEVSTVLEHEKEAQASLERYVPPLVLEVYPDWQGILVASSILSRSVWIVRIHQDGEELAKETGHPALLLDDVLSQRGRSREEARKALLPLLIIPEGMW